MKVILPEDPEADEAEELPILFGKGIVKFGLLRGGSPDETLRAIPLLSMSHESN